MEERGFFFIYLSLDLIFPRTKRDGIRSGLYSTSDIWPLYISSFPSGEFDEAENKTKICMETYLVLWEKSNSKAVTNQNRRKIIKYQPKVHSTTNIVCPDVTVSQLRPWDYAKQFTLIFPCGCPAYTFEKIPWNDNQIYPSTSHIHRSVFLWLRKRKKKKKKKKRCH